MGMYNCVSENISRNYCLAEGATCVYRYDSRKAMEAILQQQQHSQSRVATLTPSEGQEESKRAREGDVLIGFYDVPPQAIDELNQPNDNDAKLGIFKSIDRNFGAVIIMVESRIHAEATRALEEVVATALRRMRAAGVAVAAMGSQGAPQEEPIASSTKSPDVSFRFRGDVWNMGKALRWPQVVGEIGVSEPKPKLRRDARYWVFKGAGAVRITLTLNIRPNNITLTTWGKNGRALNEGGSLVARREKGTKNFIIEHDAKRLRIPFKDVFIRDANEAAGEGDFLITKEEMLQVMERIEEVRTELASLLREPDEPMVVPPGSGGTVEL